MTDGGGLRKLEDQIQLWQTPSAADVMGGHTTRSGDRKDELLLKGQVAQFATPSARDWKSETGGGSDDESPEGSRADTIGPSDAPDFPPGPGERERWAGIPTWLWPAITDEEAQSVFRRMADGVAADVALPRSDALRCCGNGVFPLAAAVAFIELTRRAGIDLSEFGVIG